MPIAVRRWGFMGPIQARPGQYGPSLSCCCILSATANDGGGRSLPHAIVLPPLQEFLLIGLAGLTTWAMVRPWW
jgi:hypothetical protein